MPFDTSWEDQFRAIDQHQQGQVMQQGLAAAATPQQATLVGQNGAAAPWVGAGPAVALGMSGIAPTDPVAQAVQQKALKKKSGGFFGMLGRIIHPAENIAARGLSDVGGFLESSVANVGSGAEMVARGASTAAMFPIQAGQGALRDVAAVGGNIAAGAAAGGLTGGAVGSFFPGAGTLIGGVVGAAAGGISGALAQQQGIKVESPGGVSNPLAQTTLWQAGQEALEGKPVSLGSGFMPGGDASKAQAELARQTANIRGAALTPGRMLAAGVFQPGSTPYNILSGSVDAIDTMKLDPTLELTKYVGDMGREANVFGDLEHRESIIGRYLNKAGAIDANAPVADTAKADKFFGSKGYQNLSQRWAEMDSPTDVWNSTKRKIPMTLARDIAGTKDASGVTDLVKEAVNAREVKDMRALTEKTGIMSTIQNNQTAARLSSYLPKSEIDMTAAYDRQGPTPAADKAVSHFEGFMKQARFDPDEMKAHLDAAISANNPADFKQAVGNAVLSLGDRLTNMGHDQDTVDKVLKSWSTYDFPEDRQAIDNELVNGTSPPGVPIGGKFLPMTKVNGIREIMEKGIPLPDSEDVRRLTTPNAWANRLYTSKTWDNVVGKADHVLAAWKKMAITRLALSPRTIMQESAGMVAQGMEAPILNPSKMITFATNAAARDSESIGATGDLLKNLSDFKENMGALQAMKPDYTGALAATKTIAPEDVGFNRVWGGQLLRLNTDPVTQYMAGHDAQATMEWLTKGEGQPILANLAKKNIALDSVDAVQTMVDNAYDHLTNITKGHPELMDAVATGKFTDQAGNVVHLNTLSAQQEQVQALAQKAAAVAEDEVRKAIKRNQTGTLLKPEGEEELDSAEKSARRAAAKAAREVAEKQYPTTYRTPNDIAVGIPEGGEHPTLPIAEAPKAAPEVPEALQVKPKAPPPIHPDAYKLIDRVEQAHHETAMAYLRDPDAEIVPGKLKEPDWKGFYNKMPQSTWDKVAEAAGVDTPVSNQMKGMVRRALERTPEEAAPVAKATEFRFSGEGEPVDWDKYAPPAPEPQGLTEEDKALVEKARQAAYQAAVENQNARLLKEAGGSFLHGDMAEHLSNIVKDPNLPNPDRLPTSLTEEEFEAKNPGAKAQKEGLVNRFFQTVVHKPLKELVRAPAFTQFYWQHIADLAPSITEEGQAELRQVMLDNRAHIPGDVRESLENALNKGSGPVPLTEAHDLAATATGESMQKNFLDLNKQQAWAESSRFVFPFAKHWQQELTKWANIGMEHPESLQKANLAIHGLQGSGFFYKNDQGQWVFNYPGSNLVTGALTGMMGASTPFPMVAQASGFSPMTQSALPGFGPMVSILASKIIPNKPQWDDVRHLLAPFGDPTQGGMLGAIEPPWMKQAQRALADPNSDRLQGNAVMEVQKYLYSTGKYKDTPEEQQRLLDDAKSAGKWLGLLRSFSMFSLPSSPTYQALAKVQDPNGDGRTIVAQKLVDDLHNMDTGKVPGVDYSNATEKFMDKYGPYAKLFLQANTRPVSAGAREDDAGLNWLRTNPTMAKKYPLVAGFFAPPEGQFDPNAYTRALHNKDIEKLTPAQQLSLANDKYGNMLFYSLKDKMGPHISAVQARTLAVIKQGLQDALPGYGKADLGLATKATPTQTIEELDRAVQDPMLAGTPVGKALSTYMQVRGQLSDMAKKNGITSFQTSAKTEGMRTIMRVLGQQLAQQTPAFGLVFDRVLDAEMKVDPATQALGQSALGA